MTIFPFQKMLYGRRVGTYLNVIHKVHLKPEVTEYILNHKVFSKPFDLIQPIQDLRKIIPEN
jgi:hypothetical protein